MITNKVLETIVREGFEIEDPAINLIYWDAFRLLDKTGSMEVVNEFVRVELAEYKREQKGDL